MFMGLMLFGLVTADSHPVVLQCVSTPAKGKGMASPKDIPPASLLHTEEPLAAVQ